LSRSQEPFARLRRKERSLSRSQEPLARLRRKERSLSRSQEPFARLRRKERSLIAHEYTHETRGMFLFADGLSRTVGEKILQSNQIPAVCIPWKVVS